MFNRTYQLRVVKKAGGGHQVVAREAGLCLPWSGLFRPVEPWRSLVMIAAAAEEIDSASIFYRPKKAISVHAVDRSKKSKCGKLQGVQLDLFPDNDGQNFTVASNFYRPAKMVSRERDAELAQHVLSDDTKIRTSIDSFDKNAGS